MCLVSVAINDLFIQTLKHFLLGFVLRALLKNAFHRGILESIFKELECFDPNMGYPVADSQYLVFNDVVFNLLSGETYEHSPDFFTTHKLGFNYQPEIDSFYTPVSDMFLDDFTDQEDDRKKYVKAILYTVL